MKDRIEFKTKSEIIFENLREKIISGEMIPGDRLIQSKIADMFGVSEVPVREAIKRLEMEDLVTYNSYMGAVVKGLALDDIKEMYIIRSELEGLAVKLAIDNFTDDDIQDIEFLINEMDQMVLEKEYISFGKLDRKFHKKICMLSENKKLYKLIESLRNETERGIAVFHLKPSRIKESNEGHKAIFAAIKQKNKEEAAELIKEQLRQTSQGLIEQLYKR